MSIGRVVSGRIVSTDMMGIWRPKLGECEGGGKYGGVRVRCGGADRRRRRGRQDE